MGLHDKNGTFLGPAQTTSSDRLTTDSADNTMKNFTDNLHGNVSGPSSDFDILYDEDDFVYRVSDDWKRVQNDGKIMYDVNTSLAIILSLTSLALVITLADKTIRDKAPTWYIFHLIAMTVFVGLLLHPMSYAELIYSDSNACYFVMYSVEYIYFGLGMGVIIYDIEIYFSKFLPLQRWEHNHISRFLISILFGWVVVSFLVAHIVITKSSSKYFCFALGNEVWRKARMVLRELIPSIICFLFTILASVTYILKRSRFTFMTSSGELKEVRSEGSDDEAEWFRCSIFLNVTVVIRGVINAALYHYSHFTTPNQYRVLLVVIFFNVQSFYVTPLGLLFIADIRATLKRFALLFINKASFGKWGSRYDRDELAVSFGNVSIES